MTPPAAATARTPVRNPRRVSGPNGPSGAKGAAAAAAAPGVAPRQRPARPRPVPARPAPARKRTTKPGGGGGARAPQTGGLVLGVLGVLTRITEHRWFDRLLRGRAWIGIVAFALIGIVSMQLVLLKLNGGIGRALEHEALLQRTNAALSVADSAASAGDLVESQAVRNGMVIIPSGAVRFLSKRRGDATHAAENLNKQVTPGTTTTTTATTTTATAAPTTASPTTASPTTASPTTASPTTTSSTAGAPTAASTTASTTAPTTASVPAGGAPAGPGG